MDTEELDQLAALIGEEIIARMGCPLTCGGSAKGVTGNAQAVARLIDHTLLRPEATHDDIVRVCREARQYGFATVCVNPYWAPLAASELRGSPVKVCTVTGFPLGATSTESKMAETAAALRVGAQEIDMVTTRTWSK